MSEKVDFSWLDDARIVAPPRVIRKHKSNFGRHLAITVFWVFMFLCPMTCLAFGVSHESEEAREILGFVILGCLIMGGVGALIGNSRGDWHMGLIAGIALGPLGWLLMAFSHPSAYLRCPACMSRIHPDAIICPFCRTQICIKSP